MNPFHRFLIKRRIYCELCDGLNRATRVIRVNGKDRVVCDWHAAGPLERGFILRKLNK